MNDKNKTNLDSVDQIRNILFGEQVKIIEKRFLQLEKNLTKSIENLSNKVDSTTKKLEVKIESANKQLSSDSSSLAEENSKAITHLETGINNKLVEVESDLLNQIHAGLQKLDEKTSHRNELANLLKEMASKLAD